VHDLSLAFHPSRRLLIALLLLAVALAHPAKAQRPSYNLDNDPMRLANKALEAGRLAEARQYFNEAVANDHHVPDALCGLAAIDLRQGLYADAEAHFLQALAASGGRQATARTGLGLLRLRQGRDEEAALEFQQVLNEDPGYWEAHYGLALLAMEDEDWASGKAHLEYGRKKRGLAEGEDKYQYGLALYLLGTGDITGAERAALHAQILNPTDPWYPLLVGRIYLDEGHDALAISTFEQALAVPGFSANAEFYHELGLLYTAENRFNEAGETYLAAVAADSTYAPALKDLADLYSRARRYDKAAGIYLRYIALVPDDRMARLELSDCLGELGRRDEAAEEAYLAWQQEPDDPVTRIQFARAGIRASNDTLKVLAAEIMAPLLASPPDDQPWVADELLDLAAWQADQKDYESAAATLIEAAKLAPEDGRVPFQQGLVELSAGRASIAVEHFQQAVLLDPDSPANYLNLGIAQYRAGELESAVPSFRQAVALRPDLASARLLLAQVLTATGALNEAEEEYLEVLATDPENARALRGQGFCRLRAADYTAAASAYSKATVADPANADGWAGLGSARLGLGDLAAAETAFAKAKAIDPENLMMKTGTQLLNQAKNAGKENQ